MNVISIDLLAKLGFKFLTKNNFCDIITNDTTIMSGQLKYGMYILSYLVGVMYTSNKYPRIDNISDFYLWYYRLGHVNKNRIDRLIKEGVFEINDCELLPACESCLLGKMTKSPFKKKDEWASDILGLIHSDVCGPMNIAIRGGYYNFITFIDDLSRYGYIYLMQYKSESFEIFKWFCNKVEK